MIHPGFNIIYYLDTASDLSALEEYTLQGNLSPAKIIDARFKTLRNNITLKSDWWFEDIDGACYSDINAAK